MKKKRRRIRWDRVLFLAFLAVITLTGVASGAYLFIDKVSAASTGDISVIENAQYEKGVEENTFVLSTERNNVRSAGVVEVKEISAEMPEETLPPSPRWQFSLSGLLLAYWLLSVWAM